MGTRSATPPSPALTIHSDGACSGNPGPGGWAVRIRYPDGRIRELGGAVPATTNNRMELWAAIQALKAAGDTQVSLITDSEYLLKGITDWIHGWKKKGWLTASKKPVLNQDLWQELDQLNHRGVRWSYTRGHAGEQGNERCDEIAQAFSRGDQPPMVDEA